MRETSKTYTALACGALLVGVLPDALRAQAAATDASSSTCAATLSSDNGPGERIGPERADSVRRRDTATRRGRDSVAFGIGGARTGNPTIQLLVGVSADEVRFARQPRVRVGLCWGGDTLRVVQRENLPSPVVAGTTYRNVYVAVEIIGRLNAECLSNALGVGNPRQQRQGAGQAAASGRPPAGSCAFLGGTAGASPGNPRPPVP